MRIVSLIDDITRGSCEAEHGLSLYIELDCGARVLFDMGQTDMFARNAERLGIDLSEVDLAVISHGHNDHGGGLETFLRINSRAQVYLRECALGEHFSLKAAGPMPIGIRLPASALGRVIFSSELERLPYGITLFSEPPHDFPEPEANGRLLGPDGARDAFAHEQSMVVQEGAHAVLFGGCAHRGIVNILSQAQSLTGGTITHVFSGMHLSRGIEPSPAYIASLAAALDSYRSVTYYTMHCTGQTGFSALQPLLPHRLHYFSAGDTYSL